VKQSQTTSALAALSFFLGSQAVGSLLFIFVLSGFRVLGISYPTSLNEWSVLVYQLSGVPLLVGSVGALRLKEWGRRSLLWGAAFEIVGVTLGIMDCGLTGEPIILSPVLGEVVAGGLLLIILWYFLRPSVKAQFQKRA